VSQSEVLFEGHAGRSCGEHRTTGGRAWCYDDSEWCYPRSPCGGCMVGYPFWEYDPVAAAGYLTVVHGIRDWGLAKTGFRTREVFRTDGVVVQVDEDEAGRLMGVEFLFGGESFRHDL
jgi:hypothetical protein